MGIRSSANKYKESSKDTRMPSQTATVQRKESQITSSVTLGKFSTDSMTKNAYKGYLHTNKNEIKDNTGHYESVKAGKLA